MRGQVAQPREIGTRDAGDVPRRWPAGGLTFAPRPLATHWKVAIGVPDDGPFAASAGEPLRALVAAVPGITEARLTTGDGGASRVECVIAAGSALDAARGIDRILDAGGFHPGRSAGGAGYAVATRILGPAQG